MTATASPSAQDEWAAFAKECRQIAEALKQEYGEQAVRGRSTYTSFKKHVFAGRAGVLLLKAAALAAPPTATPTDTAAGGERDAWIPLSERLPEDGSTVHCYWAGLSPADGIRVAIYKGGEWSNPDHDEEYVDPTHWRELPAPPAPEAA